MNAFHLEKRVFPELVQELKSVTGRKVPPFLGTRNKRLKKPSLMGGGGDFCNGPLGEEILHL